MQLAEVPLPDIGSVQMLQLPLTLRAACMMGTSSKLDLGGLRVDEAATTIMPRHLRNPLATQEPDARQECGIRSSLWVGVAAAWSDLGSVLCGWNRVRVPSRIGPSTPQQATFKRIDRVVYQTSVQLPSNF